MKTMRNALISLIALPLALFAYPASADVKAGVEAWSKGNYSAAIKSWRPLAISGDADAQFNMGQAYKLGRGVPVDLLQAEDWYRKAALQGHLQAEDNYGLVQFQNGNRQQAMPWIEKSSARGEPRAQYILGTALFNGDMVTKDWVRAYALMTRASAAGLAPASASLAQLDRYIPIDQRQKGLAMARNLELAAAKPVLAPVSPQPTRPAPVRPGSVKAVDLPPSMPNKTEVLDTNAVNLPPAAPVVTPKPRPAAVSPKPPLAQPDTSKPTAVAGKGWRVQLGAFGEESRARALFSTLEKRVGGLSGLTPYLVKAGAVTRLQAGPIASAAAADKLCAQVKAAGNGCLPLNP
jgi:uncharacterized protein